MFVESSAVYKRLSSVTETYSKNKSSSNKC